MIENARHGGQQVGVAMEFEIEKWSEHRESLTLPRHDMPIHANIYGAWREGAQLSAAT